ncbi:serine/threonine-protein kinase C-like [Penaeus vannamei]|uniref:serine/threonine-protein kinase C-like n=1 Tax=Penaeus vannamei TaxID=6689 RepID=UPI00387F7FC9
MSTKLYNRETLKPTANAHAASISSSLTPPSDRFTCMEKVASPLLSAFGSENQSLRVTKTLTKPTLNETSPRRPPALEDPQPSKTPSPRRPPALEDPQPSRRQAPRRPPALEDPQPSRRQAPRRPPALEDPQPPRRQAPSKRPNPQAAQESLQEVIQIAVGRRLDSPDSLILSKHQTFMAFRR